jgi:hypothetical protein
VRIAILGWGSLLWEPRPEFDQWHDRWKTGGPTLKLEFSRVSESRLGALTLVIDEGHGVPTTVSWCLSKRVSPEDAVCDLRSREGTVLKNIGRVDVASNVASSSQGGVETLILAWARSKKLDVVVWTALASNFTEKTKRRFSVAAALSHMEGLSAEGRVKAAEYVWRARAFVKTSVRTALQREAWFCKLAPRRDSSARKGLGK